MWQEELETAGFIRSGVGKAGELNARGDLADFGDLATEHEETASVVEMRGVVVGISLVENGEVGGIKFLAGVVDWR